MTAALTREQKLMAEQVVQLGNIAEAIRAAAAGEDSSNLLTKIEELQAELATASQERAQLTTALANANTKVAELQQALAVMHEGDITPDNINEVMSHLGIEYS
jgi:septal ring factor EnvC (AmiA/AmiB activator)